ncbi:type II secretion system protein [Lentibacillus sp. Marseille-P4043]|uniref:type II secretion system protein n=1 Tax=Lentibacillus sp. Marseille-P4043 TaxID=2040293 RepID=UPI000D0AFFBB|nr:type II secretion system protein [Lentibacillus sp. Marseille-P4043]
MNFRQYKNEHGMTLVELLAALSLFIIVITLSSTLVMEMFNNQKEASENISLKQDTNVLINTMRGKYLSGDELCFNGKDNLTITHLTISNGEEPLKTINHCVKNLDYNKPLSVKITTTNNSGNNFSLETTWNHKDDHDLYIDAGKEESENVPCKFRGSIVLDKLILKKGNCNNYYEIIGSLVVRNNTIVEENVKLKISGAAHFNKNINLYNKAKVITSGSIQVDGKALCGNQEIRDHKKSTLQCKKKT